MFAQEADKRPPSKPIFKEIEFRYDDFDFDNLIFINPTIYFIFEVERVGQRIDLCCSDYWLPENINKEKVFWSYAFSLNKYITKKDDKTYIAETDNETWEWQQYMYIAVFNSYGMTCSDTLLTSDYIKDKNIINAIRGVSAIKNINKSLAHITYSNKILSVDNIQNTEIKNIIINNISGQRIIESKTNKVDLSCLNKGIYIITVILKNNKKLTKKISI
ncbi:T9SS type A sorting domain-containing protein [Xylanibacter caecicola]|uniref:T9SS type A sorting domain-containing protein n=1 Tax=Xylanibacter caecicola TaxID=2736294 RepID=UPI00258D84A7|nr:T9SS type A sorting domain-containing protein [Xylanibacter caecicola]